MTLAFLTACSGPATTTTNNPGVAFPMHLAEGEGDAEQPLEPTPPKPKPKATPDLDPKAQHRAKYGSLPDPEPLSSKTQWELELSYEHGDIRLSSAARREFATPVTTARRMGRFAVELWIGHELIERVRFDFPLVMNEPAAAGPRGLAEPVRFDANTSSVQTLLIPDASRATRALVVDRATGQETELPWPPDRPQGPAPAESRGQDP